MKRTFSIVAGMIFVLTIFVLMVFPIFYTPTCRISKQSFGVRKARTVARLYNIAFACVEFRVPNFEDVWCADGAVNRSVCPASGRLIEFLRCVYSNDSTWQEMVMENEDEKDFGRVVRDGWGNIIRAAWWSDVKGERLERTKRVGNLVIWSVGANGVDERGEGDDITMGVDLEVTVP